MKSILRAVALSGILAMGAAAAQAQVRIGVRLGVAPAIVAAVPPCPGPGYVWTAGYYDGNMWVPGQWLYEGYGARVYVGGSYGGYYPHAWDRGGYRAYGYDRGRGGEFHGEVHGSRGDFHRR